MKMTIIFNNGNALDDCMSGLISEFGFFATEETGVFSNGDGLTIYGTDRSLHLDGEDDAVTALFNDEILPAYNAEIRKTFVNESAKAFVESLEPQRGDLKNAFHAMRDRKLKEYLVGEALETLKQYGAVVHAPEKAFGFMNIKFDDKSKE